jgi:hypothetical protein
VLQDTRGFWPKPNHYADMTGYCIPVFKLNSVYRNIYIQNTFDKTNREYSTGTIAVCDAVMILKEATSFWWSRNGSTTQLRPRLGFSICKDFEK